MTTHATSKFRINYWIQSVAGFLVLTGIACLCFYLSVDDGTVDFHHASFWLGLIIVIPLVILLFNAQRLKQIVVTPNGIRVLYSKSERIVEYSDVKKISTRRIRHLQGRSWFNPGHEIFTIHFADGDTFEFDEAQFKNYNELKIAIYNCMEEFTGNIPS